MANNQGLPIEVGFEKAKSDIVAAISRIGNEYSLPTSLMLVLLENVVLESKLNTFGTIVSHYDISQPEAAVVKSPEKKDNTNGATN